MSNLARQVINPSRKQIGYFCHLRLDDKHLGGILITNHIGVPLEFKYTEPVTATRLHKILYGSVLERHLHETVIRDRLGSEVKTLPDFFVIPYDQKEYLGPIADREVMAVQRCNLHPEELGGSFSRVRDREVIIGLQDEPKYLRLAFSTPDEALQQSMVVWLQEISQTMDVLEPLERITTALTTLCGDGKKG